MEFFLRLRMQPKRIYEPPGGRVVRIKNRESESPEREGGESRPREHFIQPLERLVARFNHDLRLNLDDVTDINVTDVTGVFDGWQR